jgi:hypothetical protein
LWFFRWGQTNLFPKVGEWFVLPTIYLTPASFFKAQRDMTANRTFLVIVSLNDQQKRSNMDRKRASWLVLGLAAIWSCGCDVSVNRSIRVRDGEHAGGQTTVNGSIHVGSRCRIDGDLRTVNGSIDVGDDSLVGGLDTVNGRIALGARVEVDGDASTVNGSIRSGSGSRVHGRLTTVNGRIELQKSEVDDALSTVNGDILLRDRSRVHGDIVIRGRRGRFSPDRRITIRIEDGSVVEGGIDVRDPGNKVEVYIGQGAEVKGEMRNAKVIREKPDWAENPAGATAPPAGR